MKFQLAEPNENLTKMCLASESGEWEIGIRDVLFGLRVSLSEVNGGGYSWDICVGNNMAFAIETLVVLGEILTHYPDEIPAIRALCQAVPRQDVRPLRIGDPYFVWLHQFLENLRKNGTIQQEESLTL